jgi:general secretion pathway protein G
VTYSSSSILRRRPGATLLLTLFVVLQSCACSLIFDAGPSSDPRSLAKVKLMALEGALALFHYDTGRFPTTSEGLGALMTKPMAIKFWEGPYVSEDGELVDPWGSPYVYRYPGQTGDFDLFSKGPDKAENSSDDILVSASH